MAISVSIPNISKSRNIGFFQTNRCRIRLKWVCETIKTILWDICDVTFIDYLQKGREINNKYHTNFLERFNVLFHQDSANVHKCLFANARFYELGYDLLSHSL